MSAKSKISNFLYIWDMLNTFFFGYLSKKWKKIIRGLSFLLFIPLSIFSSDYIGVYVYNDLTIILIFILLYINTISLISYILKPFVIKE